MVRMLGKKAREIREEIQEESDVPSNSDDNMLRVLKPKKDNDELYE